jgi:hypothetical protein
LVIRSGDERDGNNETAFQRAYRAVTENCSDRQVAAHFIMQRIQELLSASNIECEVIRLVDEAGTIEYCNVEDFLPFQYIDVNYDDEHGFSLFLEGEAVNNSEVPARFWFTHSGSEYMVDVGILSDKVTLHSRRSPEVLSDPKAFNGWISTFGEMCTEASDGALSKIILYNFHDVVIDSARPPLYSPNISQD